MFENSKNSLYVHILVLVFKLKINLKEVILSFYRVDAEN